MTRSERFKPLVEQAEQREADAVRLLGQCQAKRKQLSEKAAMLKRYRDDYSARFAETGANGLNIRQMLEYLSFQERLNEAIREQEKQIESVDMELGRHRQNWEAARMRRAGLQKVQVASYHAELQAMEQREQREADDRASRSAGSRWRLTSEPD